AKSTQQEVHQAAEAGMPLRGLLPKRWPLKGVPMPAPSTVEEFLDLTRKSGVVTPPALEAAVSHFKSGPHPPAEPKQLAGQLVRNGILTIFQAEQLLRGRWRGFNIGNIKFWNGWGSEAWASFTWPSTRRCAGEWPLRFCPFPWPKAVGSSTGSTRRPRQLPP